MWCAGVCTCMCSPFSTASAAHLSAHSSQCMCMWSPADGSTVYAHHCHPALCRVCTCRSAEIIIFTGLHRSGAGVLSQAPTPHAHYHPYAIDHRTAYITHSACAVGLVGIAIGVHRQAHVFRRAQRNGVTPFSFASIDRHDIAITNTVGKIMAAAIRQCLDPMICR